MEQFLQNILGIDNYQKYGFYIILISGYFLTITFIYFIIFSLTKIRELISDKNDKILYDNEEVLFIIDKQKPTYLVSIFYLPLVFWINFVFWQPDTFKPDDMIFAMLFGLFMLIYTYMFLNSFFIKLIMTNQRLLYRNLLNLNYKIISLNDIQKVTTYKDSKFGELLNIKTKEKSSEINLRVLKNANEAQITLETLIMSQEEALKSEEKRKKHKLTHWQMALGIILGIAMFVIIRLH